MTKKLYKVPCYTLIYAGSIDSALDTADLLCDDIGYAIVVDSKLSANIEEITTSTALAEAVGADGADMNLRAVDADKVEDCVYRYEAMTDKGALEIVRELESPELNELNHLREEIHQLSKKLTELTTAYKTKKEQYPVD